MTSQARIRKALTALEARRLELERVISDDMDRKYLSLPEPVTEAETTTTALSGSYSFVTPDTTAVGFSTITWLA